MKIEISGRKMLRFFGLRIHRDDGKLPKLKKERRKKDRETLDSLTETMNKLQRGMKKQEEHMAIKEDRLAMKVLDLQREITKAAEERKTSENIARNMQIMLTGRIKEDDTAIDAPQFEAIIEGIQEINE